MGQSPPPGPGAAAQPAAAPPAQVVTIAQQHQLGEHLTSRTPPHPVVAGMVSLSIAGGALLLLVVAGMLASATDGYGAGHSALRSLAIFSCVAFVVALVKGIAALARTAESFHLYAGGLAHRRGGQVRVVSWPEAAELRPLVNARGRGAGQISHYRLVPHQGASIPVPLMFNGGRDPFMEQLMAAVHRHGIPIRR